MPDGSLGVCKLQNLRVPPFILEECGELRPGFLNKELDGTNLERISLGLQGLRNWGKL